MVTSINLHLKSDPEVSVVISTRNRGLLARSAVESILNCVGIKFELIIVDQSEDCLTESALRPLLHHKHVRYIKSESTGLSAARNIGIREARSQFVAFTDDDCIVEPHWLRNLVEPFLLNPNIGLVFGNVVPGPFDPNAGFIPAYVRTGSSISTSIAQKHKTEGIGACMSLRRKVWDEIGGFDEMLGAGSLIGAGEEVDFSIRALQAGYSIYETDKAIVTHFGFREIKVKTAAVHRYLYGLGATYAKHLKCRRWSVLIPLYHLATRWSFGIPAASYGKVPSKTNRLRGFLSGLIAGLALPVERSRALYAGKL